MSNIIDALVYTSIKNNIPSNNDRFNELKKATSITSTDTNKINDNQRK